ncbi:Conserved hypothetical protein [Candidatus Protochlamydia naegleriophila]|uniref:Uncharacterized protein n=1 Tax=Candidatus Protochlamydia naegleriophila TaxID=389348 RepID=A0A0U5K6M0_9BACT|nr:hypothetical protein [Candidatus Protochlamydia naegleriophila]CUI17803.1 Conserved hypothetical protein [Candidatus Protochlamydia naegleriophila]
MINNFESFFYQFYSTIENGKNAFDKAMQADQNTIEKTQLLQRHFLQVQEDLNQLLDIKAKVELLSIDELYKQECPLDVLDESMRHIQYVSFVEFAEQEKNELLSQIQLVSQHTVQWLNESQTAAGLSNQKNNPSLSHQIVNLLTIPIHIFQQSINYLWPFGSSSSPAVSNVGIDSPTSRIPVSPISTKSIDSETQASVQEKTVNRGKKTIEQAVNREERLIRTPPPLPPRNYMKAELNSAVKNRFAEKAVDHSNLQSLPQTEAMNREEKAIEQTVHLSPLTTVDILQRPSLKDRLTHRTPPPLPPRSYKKAVELNPIVDNQGSQDLVESIENLQLLTIQNPAMKDLSLEKGSNKVQSQASKDLEVMTSSSRESEAKMEQLEAAHKTDFVVKSTNGFIPEPPPFKLLSQPNTTSASRPPKQENHHLGDFLTNSLILRRSQIIGEEPESPSTPMTPITTKSFNDITTHSLNAGHSFQVSDPVNLFQKPIEQDRGSLLDSITKFNKNQLKAVVVEEKVEEKSTLITNLKKSMSNLGFFNVDNQDSDSDFDSDLEDW